MSPKIRPATPDDAREIAVAHVRSWQGAYRGVLPDAFLDGLDVEPRTRGWRDILGRPSGGRAWVSTTGTDALITGFVHVTASRDDDTDPGVCGEVTSIYVVPDEWGTGAGRALMTAALDGLTADGYAEATLWVLRGNDRATRFYRATGWTEDGVEKQDEIADTPITEIRFRRPLPGA